MPSRSFSASCVFQSTLPARGATNKWFCRFQNSRISIHAPRTGSDPSMWTQTATSENFNPRSPHGERQVALMLEQIHRLFQSTLPARGATAGRKPMLQSNSISIHAPRTGSDTSSACPSGTSKRFQSTLPARGATTSGFADSKTAVFQSTLPARGATDYLCGLSDNPQDFNPRSPHGERRVKVSFAQPNKRISIHAPRTGSDEFPC